MLKNKVCEDRSHEGLNEGLNEEEIRDKVLSRKLSRDDCDELEMFQFLSLLRINLNAKIDNIGCTRDKEWIKALRKEKRNSASSVFSKRNHAMHKCTLFSERVVNTLVKFYNLMLDHNHYPGRRLKVLGAIIEKEKVLCLANQESVN